MVRGDLGPVKGISPVRGVGGGHVQRAQFSGISTPEKEG